MKNDRDERILETLYYTILSKKNTDPKTSYSAQLLSKGPKKVAQKFGEEATECLIEAAMGNKQALIAESADMLYHLLVLWVSNAVEPEDVWSELHRRQGISGLTEKASRTS